MRFEARELKPYIEPVRANELVEGSVYFSVGFVDADMLIPVVETLVFIGRNLEPGDAGQVYFQDVESFREGARYPTGAPAANECKAKFLRVLDNHYVLQYEDALNQLLACSLRRQATGEARTDVRPGGPVCDVSPGASPRRYIRFEDPALHEAFVRELERFRAPYSIDCTGAVTFDESDSAAVNDAAHRVRDEQFPWYFLTWETERQSARFRGAIAQAGLAFFIEHHDSGTCFVVRKADREHHASLSAQVLSED
jgi:hypothetical protein